MTSKPHLDQDSRWQPFVERYAFDLCAFAIEVCGLALTFEQMRVFNAMQDPKASARTTEEVDTSRTLAERTPTTLAVVTLWQLFVYHRSNTYIAVTANRKWTDELAPEIARVLGVIAAGDDKWIADYVRFTRDRIYVWGHRATWFAVTRSAQERYPENLAGTWGPHLLWIIHDADQIAPVCKRVIRGSTSHCGRVLEAVTRRKHLPKAPRSPL